ncbi:MAG: ABC transporter permease [Actinomycetota bacterium]
MELLLDALRWLADGGNWQGSDGVPNRLFEHLWVTVVSMGIACAVAIPVGLWLGHLGRGGTVAINISNAGRAVPTLAILVLLVLGPIGLSVWSTIIALLLFALPPVLTNTYVGMRDVSRDAVEAARGMGMSGRQLLAKVEFPLALPLIMTGIRLAAVQVVATLTIAALVAGPGLGRIITAGFGRQDYPQMVAGALLVAVVALLVEWSLAWLQRRIDPMRLARLPAGGRAAARNVTEA